MMRTMRRIAAAMAVSAALMMWTWTEYGPAARVEAFTLTELGKLSWYGPVGISRGQTALFNYSNFAAEGTPPVQVQWAFSDAITGELIVGNFGKPRMVEAMKGLVWRLDGEKALEGRDQSRRQVVGWLLVEYESKKARSQGVDLANVEIAGSESMMTSVVIHANPIAPGDRYSILNQPR